MHFVLDQNFPFYVADIQWTRPDLRITRLFAIDPELTHDHEDCEVFLALHSRSGIDGFVTNDDKVLKLPTEMVALQHTSLVLVITKGVGHQPIRATGLLMVHLESIANQRTGKPQIWILQPARLHAERPWTYLNSIAKHRDVPVDMLVDEERKRIGVPKSALPTDV